MRKNIILVSALLLILTGVYGLSLNDDIIDTVSNDSEDSLQETVEQLESSISGERKKYILMVDPANYRPTVLEDLGINIRYDYSIIDGVAVEMPSDLADTLDQLEFVGSVEPDPVTSLPLLEGEASKSESESYSGADGRVIAVLDTGIDNNHVDLENEVVDNQDFTGLGAEDRHGHGTHVASIAAGTGSGNPEHIGVAPEASLMNVKVLGDDGSGRASDAIKGLEYSVENDADIAVMSLGVQTECDGNDPLSQAADNAVEKGLPVVVAAGNEGPDSETITSPGCGHQVLTVGASGNNRVASFSSRGATADGRTKPDITAPGVNIYAAEAGTTSSYISKSGTSMSAPYVGGAVAILMDRYENSPEDYFEALTETAYSLNAESNAEGSGKVNITAALNYHKSKTGERTDESISSGDKISSGEKPSDSRPSNNGSEEPENNSDTDHALNMETSRVGDLISLVVDLLRSVFSY